jgi:hypothetical protein
MSISAHRKSVFENRPTGSKVRQTQRRPVRAAALRVHPFGVNAAELVRREFLHLAGGAAALPAFSRIARAQAYPTRPITIIVPVAAGGQRADLFAGTAAAFIGSPGLADGRCRSSGAPLNCHGTKPAAQSALTVAAIILLWHRHF